MFFGQGFGAVFGEFLEWNVEGIRLLYEIVFEQVLEELTFVSNEGEILEEFCTFLYYFQYRI